MLQSSLFDKLIVKWGEEMDIEQIALKLQETDDRSHRNEGRIKKLEEDQEAIQELTKSVALMAKEMEYMNKSVSTLTSKVDAIEKKPAQRWDNIVDKVIWAVLGAAIAYILAGVGL